MEILFILLVLLVITRAFGEFAARLGQPAIVGELLSGITLGIVIQFSLDLFPIMKNINDNEVFTSLTDLGIFFLLPTSRCVMGHAGRFLYVDRSSELGRFDMIKKIQLRFIEDTGLTPFTHRAVRYMVCCKG